MNTKEKNPSEDVAVLSKNDKNILNRNQERRQTDRTGWKKNPSA